MQPKQCPNCHRPLPPPPQIVPPSQVYVCECRTPITIFAETAQSASLARQVQTLQTQNQTLQTQNKTLQDQNKTLQDKNQTLQQEIDELRKLHGDTPP